MIRLTVAGGVAEGDPLWLRAEEILAITMEHGTPNPSTVVILNGLKFDVKETVDEVVALVKGA